MPTYEYLCRTCSHRFEAWQKMIDDPLSVCPECGGQIRRVLYPTGIVFKGSGFYKTDHSSSSMVSSNDHTAKSDSQATTTETKTSGENKTSESAKPGSTSENKVAQGVV